MSSTNNVINVANYNLNTLTWTSFTTTITATITNPTPGSGYTLISSYLQVGKLLYIQMYFSSPNAGSAGNGIYLFNLPTGFTMNTSVVPAYSATAQFCLGSAQNTISGSGSVGGAIAYNSGNYCLYGSDPFGDLSFIQSGFYDLSNAGVNYATSLIVPIN